MGAYVKRLIDFDMQQPLVAIGSNVKLQMEYVGVSDRETLGDIARDILFGLTDGHVQQEKLARALGPRVDLSGPGDGIVEEKKGGENDDDEVEEDKDHVEKGIAFVDKMVEEMEKKGVGTFDGSYSSLGVSKVGSLAADLADEETTHKTKLTGLDAESKGFREELRKRKEHYKEGLDGVGGGGGGEKKEKKLLGSKSSNSIITKIDEVKLARENVVDVPLSPTVYVSDIKDMKMTRPAGPKPPPRDASPVASVASTSILDDTARQLKMSALTEGASVSSGGKSFVSFVRPKESFGLFIDPTFTDDTEVTEATLAELGNEVGAPRMLSAASIITGDTDADNIETYGHKKLIMGTMVDIKGKRIKGDSVKSIKPGVTPVTFDNVHQAATSRTLAKYSMK